MKADTYREHLNDLQLEVEELRAKLKATQTGDLISRRAAIDALDGVSWMHLEGKHEICDGDWIKADEAEEALKQLPSAQPEQRWIPVSERLPKPFEHCLWTTTDGRVVYHHCDGLFSNYTAWMPLPEPYMERRTDE